MTPLWFWEEWAQLTYFNRLKRREDPDGSYVTVYSFETHKPIGRARIG
jgi:hypothetical protein